MASSIALVSPPAPSADVYSDAYDEQYARWCAEVDGDPELIGSLSALPAGPLLVDLLSRLDPASLNDVECLAYAGAVRRQQGWADALLTRAAARFVEHRPGPPREYESLVAGSEQRIHLGGELTAACGSYAAAEWGAATGTSTWAAARLLADSIDLDVRLAGIRAAMWAGSCDLRTARLVAARTRDLSAHTAYLVQNAVLSLLPGLTRTQLETVIDSVAARVQPDVLADRAAQVRDRREVWIGHTADDHAEIAGTLDTVDAHRLDVRLDELARLLGTLQRAGIPGWGPTGTGPTAGTRETWQQRRARALGLLADPDTITALITAARAITHPGTTTTGTGPNSGSAGGPGSGSCADASGESDTVGATGGCAGCTPAGTGTGLRSTTVYVHVCPDGTVDLDGHGVLSLPTVRDLLDTTTVTVRPVIDLNTPNGSVGYTPSDTLSESVVVRNPTCVFPSCERPSRQCDLDHNVPWPHGPTCSCNLGPLCRHHHHVKTHGQWTVIQTSPGVFRWRSPTGAVYVVDPERTRRL